MDLFKVSLDVLMGAADGMPHHIAAAGNNFFDGIERRWFVSQLQHGIPLC